MDRGQIAMMTKNEARAAIEAQLFAMKLTRPLTPVKKLAFCALADRHLGHRSPDAGRMEEIQAWVESWQSLWLPQESSAR